MHGWTRIKLAFYRASTMVWGAATAFFAFFGASAVYEVMTFEGEGSLGTVGLYIAAWLFPFLAVFFAACTWLAWRRVRALQASARNPLP